MDIEFIKHLYLNEFKSTTDISKIISQPISKIRNVLLNFNILRTRAEGILLARHKLGKHMVGKRFIRSDATKLRSSESAKKRWLGKAKGERIRKNGYIEITSGENVGRLKHRVIMEGFLGRKLNNNEVVHHKNEIKNDNRLENLQIMTISEHSIYHGKINYKKRILNHKKQFK